MIRYLQLLSAFWEPLTRDCGKSQSGFEPELTLERTTGCGSGSQPWGERTSLFKKFIYWIAFENKTLTFVCFVCSFSLQAGSRRLQLDSHALSMLNGRFWELPTSHRDRKQRWRQDSHAKTSFSARANLECEIQRDMKRMIGIPGPHIVPAQANLLSHHELPMRTPKREKLSF